MDSGQTICEPIQERTAAYLDAAEITDSNLRAQVQRATLGAITRSIDTFVAKSGSVSTPAPLSGGPGNRGHAIE